MNFRDIDRLALEAAHALTARQPQAKFIGNALNGLIGSIDGADSQEQGAEQQYANAADASNRGYDGAISGTDAAYAKAIQQLLAGANGGSAQTFAADTAAGLQPAFDTQQKNLAARESAMGILNSGGAKADFSNLVADQGATLAGDVAPLYANEQNAYDSLISGGAGADASLYGAKAGSAASDYGAGAGAGVNAYNTANQQFYSALAAAAGAPGAAAAQPTPPAPTPSTYNGYVTGAPDPGYIPGSIDDGTYNSDGSSNPYTSSDGNGP